MKVRVKYKSGVYIPYQLNFNDNGDIISVHIKEEYKMRLTKLRRGTFEVIFKEDAQ